jgi:hypothetical protein
LKKRKTAFQKQLNRCSSGCSMWRKVLQICKQAAAAFGVCTFFTAAADTFTTTNGNTTITMPTISAPTMPSVSMPADGEGYYVPGSASFYSPAAATGSTTPAAAQNSVTAPAAATTPVAATTPSAVTAANAAAALQNTANSVSASDMSSLDSMGILGSVSSLLGKAGTTGNALTTTQDSVVLQQILAQLTDLKKDLTTRQTPAAAQPAVSGPRILRFTINGTDVLPTCKTVYFSKKESDGTFLLTGDRKYAYNGRTYSETFYFLFRSKGAQGGTTQYSVTPVVSPDYGNGTSMLCQLAAKQPLSAQRTGNLVTMRSTAQSPQFDLLLDLGN